MSFGSGLGTVIGSDLASHALDSGQSSVNTTAGNFTNTTAPYNEFGQSFLQPAAAGVSNINSTAGTQSYEDFMKNYQTSPGAQYQIGLANEGQNNSAAASGKLLSGGNERALSTIDQGIGSTYANQAYGSYLQGNQQNFGQLQSALGDMFGAIGVGTTATGQQAGVDNAQIGATSQIAQAQAKNDQSKGTGLGTMFSGLGSMATTF